MKTQQKQLKQILSEEVQRRNVGKSSLLNFIKYLKPDYVVKPFHEIICKACEQWINNPGSRLIICAPPRSGKSEIVSRYLPAYIFGLNANTEIIGCSYSQTLASSMNRDVQRIIDSAPYKQLFPKTTLLGKGTQSKHVYVKNNDMFEIVNARGKYICSGTQGGITGKGFRYGIIDDPFAGAEDSNSPTIQDWVWNWFNGEFLTRQSANASILVMATRWNISDLIGKILQQSNAEQWKVISFPLIAEEHKGPYEYRQTGEVLWPENYSEERLRELQQDAYTFSALYQQDPIAKGGNVIKKDWFGLNYVMPQFISTAMYWDIATSSNPKADSTVGTVIGKTTDGKYVVIYQDGFRLDPAERNRRIIATSLQFKDLYPSMQIFLESGFGAGAPDVNGIQTDMLTNTIAVTLDKPNKSKYLRSDAFLAAAGANKITLATLYNHPNNWIDAFFAETLQLQFKQGPKGTEWVGGHDDRLDSAAGAFNKVNKNYSGIQFIEDIIAPCSDAWKFSDDLWIK